MGDQFHSGGGQNVGQGDHAIGKQVNITQQISGNSNVVAGGNITYGVPLEKYDQMRDECERLKLEYGIKDAAFASFFRILNQENVPCAEWGAKLPEIAFRYKELLQRFEAVTSDDPQVNVLKEQAKQAIENGEYDQADMLLNQAKERDRAAVATLKASLAEQQAALEKRQLSEAQSCVEQADLQRLQYRYEKSAKYFQEAAAALPKRCKWKRSVYLGWAGYDLEKIARYTEALRFNEQSLSLACEIGDHKGQAALLNNISQIYHNQGDYSNALEYLEQSLPVFRELGDKEGEGVTLINIATLAYAKSDYAKALKYTEQSLPLLREAKDKKNEGTALNNIGQIYKKQGDDAAALQFYEQALAVAREIKDKHGESTRLNNISLVYRDQENYDAALEQLEQSLAISQQISDRRQEGTTLNNIAAIYKDKGDCSAALKQYEQSLAIAKEIGDKAGEAIRSWNIGLLHKDQGKLAKAEQYLVRAVELMEQLEHPDLEVTRKILKDVRAKLRGAGGMRAA